MTNSLTELLKPLTITITSKCGQMEAIFRPPPIGDIAVGWAVTFTKYPPHARGGSSRVGERIASVAVDDATYELRSVQYPDFSGVTHEGGTLFLPGLTLTHMTTYCGHNTVALAMAILGAATLPSAPESKPKEDDTGVPSCDGTASS